MQLVSGKIRSLISNHFHNFHYIVLLFRAAVLSNCSSTGHVQYTVNDSC